MMFVFSCFYCMDFLSYTTIMTVFHLGITSVEGTAGSPGRWNRLRAIHRSTVMFELFKSDFDYKSQLARISNLFFLLP